VSESGSSLPFIIGGKGPPDEPAPPAAGEGTESVLAELGYDVTEIERLYENDIVS
jgi:crotonobetainyl-CoA:carnitine CoA-transferase CaiB-like acyl-CoA transferase